MCGIIGVIHVGGVHDIALNGLAHLEYRGYDSAGIAVSDGVSFRRIAVVGRIGNLRQAAAGVDGAIAIGHTRWATHGRPAPANAHPLRAGRILLAHNGIIENHAELRAELSAAGRIFSSETDSEVVAHLLDDELTRNGDLLTALNIVCHRLQGAYALAAVAEGMSEIAFVRHGSPLLAGFGRGGVYLASDRQALAGAAEYVSYLEEGDSGRLSVGEVELFNAAGEKITNRWTPLAADFPEAQLGEYRHFMQKEIFDQPDAVAATMDRFVKTSALPLRRFGAGATAAFRRVRSVTFIACGTSYYAGMVARCWLENYGVPCRVELASEYRYRPDPAAASSLVIAVSQSGETADTLSALRAAKAAGAVTLAVVNVEMSSMMREADFVLRTHAGVEIGVASTKAFTAQLTALLLLTLALAKARRRLPEAEEADRLLALRRLPYLLRKALLLEPEICRWASELATANSVVFIGRRAHFPLALEGALKLKEISYIHAEGCAAGELKHGSLALVDSDLPVIGLVPDDDLCAKMTANLSEVAVRGGRLYVVAGRRFELPGAQVVRLEDDGGALLSPMITALPLQLLAYHTARRKGTDIDKPRNLAKSVTVE